MTDWLRGHGKRLWHIQRYPTSVNLRNVALCGFDAGCLGAKHAAFNPTWQCQRCVELAKAAARP